MFLRPACGKIILQISNLQKFQPSYNKLKHARCISVAKMSAEAKWKIEKNKNLNMSKEERRELYKAKDYVNLDKVDPWNKYTILNDIENKKPNGDDLNEFKKITLDVTINKQLAEKVSIYKGDITKLEVDAIVNAANSQLKAGGGVDGAIHRAAGSLLQEELNTLGGCPTGEAKITGAYNLPAKYVIATVGPQDGSSAKLQSCYENCFTILNENKLKSIAFPCISTGIYGFPNRLASHIALRTARKVLENNKDIERVIFCTFLPVDVEIYETLLQIYFPVQ